MGKKFNSPLDAAALGRQLREARLNRGYSLVQVGRIVSVDHSQVSRYERGQMNSVGKNLQKICTFLQVETDTTTDSLPRTPLGRKVDELLSRAPRYEPALAKLVEAMEELLTAAHVSVKNPDQ
ncbi:helix-turn-helix domain-containing protein [Pseudomonas putida]